MAKGDLRGTLSVSIGSVTNPLSATGSVSVSIGDLIVAGYAERPSNTGGNVTDNLGHGPYSAKSAAVDAGNATLRCYYHVATAAGTLTSVSIATTASSQDAAFGVMVLEGPYNASPLDASPTAVQNDTTTPFTGPLSGTLAEAIESVVSIISVANGRTMVASSPNLLGVSIISGGEGASNTVGVALGYQTTAATTSIAPAWTSAAAPGSDVIETMSFKFAQGALTASLFTNTTTFHQPTVAPGAVGLTPSLFSEGDTFFQPTVASTYLLTASLYADGDTFHQPTVSPGAVDLAPALYIDTDSFHTPIVASAVNLVVSLYNDDDVFYSPTLTGEGGLAASLYVDGDTFHQPTVTPGAIDLVPGLYADADTFHQPSVAALNELTPVLYTDSDTFFVHSISSGGPQELIVALFSSTPVFYVPVVDIPIPLTPARIVEAGAEDRVVILAEEVRIVDAGEEPRVITLGLER